jgi:hypothetical protein
MNNKVNKNADIGAKIPVVFFEEGDKVIAYSPALDLSTYGSSEEQARKRFIEAAAIFFNEILEKGTLDEVLEECGWRKAKISKSWSPPVFRTCTEETIQIPTGVH